MRYTGCKIYFEWATYFKIRIKREEYYITTNITSMAVSLIVGCFSHNLKL